MAQGRTEDFIRVLDLGPLVELLRNQLGPRALERVFSAQEVPLSLLDDPLQLIPLRDFCGLHEWAVRTAGDSSFGAELARSFTVEQLGPFGDFLYSGPTLGAMIRRASRALALNQTTGRVSVDVKNGTARYAFSTVLGSLVGKRYVGMRAISSLMSLARGYLGADWLPEKIEVEYGKSADALAYEAHFGVPVIYDSDAFALSFPCELLETRHPKPPQRRMTVRELAQRLRTLPPRTISGATRAVLAIRLLEGDGDIEGTASKLGLGPRTLQRRLREEGTSYRDMLSSVRLERAMSLLKESNDPIETIARSLGYAATSHFTRAFTQWTGEPPSRVRQQHRRTFERV